MKWKKAKAAREHKRTILEEENWLLTEQSPFSVQEAYKAIRTNLIFSLPGEQCKKIMVTSPGSEEGKSITTANLAISFAQNGSKVLLIDCDLRLPTAAAKLKAKQSPGLTNTLVGINPLMEVIQHLPNKVDFLASGDIPPNPSELLGSEQMVQLVESLEKDYEFILFDTPPIGAVVDGVILSRIMSGIVIVTRSGRTTQDSVDMALNKLQLADAKILGFILTSSITPKDKKYGYGYGYDYSYTNHSHANKKAPQ